MELKDLMIGDWVYENKEGIDGTIFKNQKTVETLEDLERYKTYEPININDAVLANLGFCKEGDYRNDECWEYNYKNNHFYIIKIYEFNKPNKYSLCYIDVCNNGSDCLQEIGKPFQYVHELQHLINSLS